MQLLRHRQFAQVAVQCSDWPAGHGSYENTVGRRMSGMQRYVYHFPVTHQLADQTVHLMSRLHQDTVMLPDTSCIYLSPSTCFLYWRQNCRQFVARLLLKSTVT